VAAKAAVAVAFSVGVGGRVSVGVAPPGILQAERTNVPTISKQISGNKDLRMFPLNHPVQDTTILQKLFLRKGVIMAKWESTQRL
jgi:hypothetical protein